MARSDRFLSVSLPVAGVQPCPEDATWVCCLRCSHPLELQQPDAQEPQRFIGTCGSCGRWYLLDWDSLAADGLMLLLPTHEELRATYRDGQA